MITSSTQVTVRYAETDMMGIVYHANYLPWFEIGRTTLLKENGFSYRELEAAGYRLPIVEIGAKYRRPALYDDTITIISTLTEKPSLRIKISYEVKRGEELLMTGHSQNVFVDMQGMPTRPPEAFVRKMDELFAEA